VWSVTDHVQYSDADYATCIFVEGNGDVDFLSLPIVGFVSTDYVSKMPTKIYNFLAAVEQKSYHGLSP